MKIIFANDSMAKLKFLALSDETGSGFLRTERIGKNLLITDLIPGNLCSDSITKDLLNVYDLWGVDFGGVYMKESRDLIPECFLEKIVMKIEKENYRIYYFNSDNMKHDLVQEGTLDNM